MLHVFIPRLNVPNEGICLSILKMFFSVPFTPTLLFESKGLSGIRGAPAHLASKLRPQEVAATPAAQV